MRVSRNLMVELYFGKSVVGYLARDIDEMLGWMLNKGVDDATAQSTVDCLLYQLKDPAKYPNAIIFRDEEGKSISLEDYTKRYQKV